MQFVCPTSERIELHLKYGVPIAPFSFRKYIKQQILSAINAFKDFVRGLKIECEQVESIIDIPEGLVLIKSSGTEYIRRN